MTGVRWNFFGIILGYPLHPTPSHQGRGSYRAD
jgi:hypothetical protein